MNKEKFLETSKAELGRMTTHALLTRFTKPIFLDLYIPDEYNTRKLMFVLRDNLLGKKVNPKELNCLSYHDEPLKWDGFERLEGRIGKGIELAFKYMGDYDIDRPHRDDAWYIAERVISNNHLFGREHFVGFGTMHRYRDEKRQEFSKQAKHFFTSKESAEFDRIWTILKPYVGKTNSPAKINQ